MSRYFACIAILLLACSEVRIGTPVIQNQTAPGMLRPFGNGRVAFWEDQLAFLYLTEDFSTWLYTAGLHLRLPQDLNHQERDHANYVLTSPTDLWLFSGVMGRGSLRHYRIEGSEVKLMQQEEIGDEFTRPRALIRLASGALVGGWYQHQTHADTHVEVGFFYINPAGELQLLETIPVIGDGGGIVASNWAMEQHPEDGSIWAFFKRDSYHEITALHLSETADSLTLDWVETDFIRKPDHGVHAPEGEFPHLASTVDPQAKRIVLAYQNDEYEIFYAADGDGNYRNGSCPDPGPGVMDPHMFAKGTPVSIASITADGGIEFTALPDRVERVGAFALGFSDHLWLAYQPIGCEHRTHAEMTTADVYVRAWQNGEWSEKRHMGKPDAPPSGLTSWPIAHNPYGNRFFFRLQDETLRSFVAP